MKTATIRQLRHDLKTVLSWVAQGEEIQVSNRGTVVARLLPPAPVKKRKKPKWPDFEARLKEIFGDRPPLPSNAVLDEREESRW